MRKPYVAPYVASPMEAVMEMLILAQVKRGELVCDPGCGDGRILIVAANFFGAKGLGIELNRERYRLARMQVKKFGLEKMVEIVHGNMFDYSFDDADVMTLYLMPEANSQLRPKLERELKDSARVVSHDFEIKGWRCSKAIKFGHHEIYLYRMRDIYHQSEL